MSVQLRRGGPHFKTLWLESMASGLREACRLEAELDEAAENCGHVCMRELERQAGTCSLSVFRNSCGVGCGRRCRRCGGAGAAAAAASCWCCCLLLLLLPAAAGGVAVARRLGSVPTN